MENCVPPARHPTHLRYALAHQLRDKIDAFEPVHQESNGFADSRQVLIWRIGGTEAAGWKDGEEIMRSENAKITITERFKELALEAVNKYLTVGKEE